MISSFNSPRANPFLQGTQATAKPNVPKKKFQGKTKSKQPNSADQGKTATGSPAIDNKKSNKLQSISRAVTRGTSAANTNPFAKAGAKGSAVVQPDDNDTDDKAGAGMIDDNTVVSMKKATPKKKFIGKLKGFAGGAIGRGFGK